MSVTKLRLYNTLTRRKEDFVPINPDHVRMYVCGPTVYDFAHIGNARPVIVFDVLFRLLRHVYGAKHVTYARNLTDVDDKINARAVRDYPDLPLNEAIRKVTESTAAQFQRDVTALGNWEPSSQPRATEHLEEMRQLINRLIERKHAYVADDHVLFDVKSMTGEYGPRYGALARRNLDEMIAGARVDVASYKNDEMDFVLWKPSKQGEPGWPSPAGITVNGRPGWHIECSAMSMAKLLEPFGGGLKCDDPLKNTFDIHAGGIDLVFPHHENEIAQSCCAFGSERMANIWMHNGFLQVEGQKMSKSLGNFITINELLNTKKFGGRKWKGEILRLAMLMTHYREPINFSVSKLIEAENRLKKWKEIASVSTSEIVNENAYNHFIEILSVDLNTTKAFMYVDELSMNANIENSGAIYKILSFIGFKVKRNEFSRLLKISVEASKIIRSIDVAKKNELTHSLNVEKTNPNVKIISIVKNFRDLSDLYLGVDGDKLQGNNVISSISNEIFEFSRSSSSNRGDLKSKKTEQYINERLKYLKNGDFTNADRIRDELKKQNIQLKDGKDPATGERVTTWEVKR